MKNILLLPLLFFSLASFAESNLTLVMDTKPVGSVIKISKYLGDLEIPLDSLRYRGETEIKFAYDKRYTNGVYVVDVSTLESFQFVLINQESITAHIYESGSGMAFKSDGSDENGPESPTGSISAQFKVSCSDASAFALHYSLDGGSSTYLCNYTTSSSPCSVSFSNLSSTSPGGRGLCQGPPVSCTVVFARTSSRS